MKTAIIAIFAVVILAGCKPMPNYDHTTSATSENYPINDPRQQQDRPLIRYIDSETGITCYRVEGNPELSCVTTAKSSGTPNTGFSAISPTNSTTEY